MKGPKLVSKAVAKQERVTVGGRYADNVQPSVYAIADSGKSFDGTNYEKLELRFGNGETDYEFVFFMGPGQLERIKGEIDRVLARNAKEAAVA